MAQGSIKAISEIYRDLRLIEAEKDLSFGEKNLLQQTEKLLAEEISLVRSTEQERAIEQIRALCKPRLRRRMIEEYTL
jgi:CarD family transcriptional regulator